MTNESDIKLTAGCINLLSDIDSTMYRIIIERSISYVLSHDRTLISVDDIMAILKPAFCEALDKTITIAESMKTSND